MTLANINTKLLTTPAGKFDNTLSDVIADLEIHFQGTSTVRNAINASLASGKDHQLAILEYFNSISSTAYADAIVAAGLEKSTGTPQNYDLLSYRDEYFVAIYMNSNWVCKCSGDTVANIFDNARSVNSSALQGVFTMYRFTGV